MPIHKPIEHHHAKTLDTICAGLANVIDGRTVGQEDCSTAIANLAFFRRGGH